MTRKAKAFYTSHPICHEHRTGEGHPESHHRLEAILPVLKHLLPRIEAPRSSTEEIAGAHTHAYIEQVFNATPQEGYAALDADTIISPQSGEAARRAAGAALQAVDKIMAGEANFIFNALRPPGHHAVHNLAGGFCLFNNVALGALHALNNKGLKRVVIIDPDVHHGNGTQDIMWNEERCLFVSSHQSPLFPYTGAADETGSYNNILNIPLPADTDGTLMREVYESQVFPRVRAFKPEFIFVSAGFDAHKADPLAALNWTTEDFGWLGQQIKDLADDLCEGRVMATLEGGYDLDALAASVEAFIKPFVEE